MDCRTSNRGHGVERTSLPRKYSMVQQLSILIACVLLAPGCSDDDSDEPEEDGDGTLVLDLGSGRDSFWIDTDGVDPEVPGCHIELGDSSCAAVAVSARNFGEFCQEDGTLV